MREFFISGNIVVIALEMMAIG